MTYRPPHVRADERAPLLALIAAHPLATFITVAEGEPVVTYVPLLAREEDGAVILEGHLARANNQWRGWRRPGRRALPRGRPLHLAHLVCNQTDQRACGPDV
jgi:predicted FMN-binding regulatory protein PaiB